MEKRFEKPVPCAIHRTEAVLQPITERHELIHFGDDAELLGKGRDWYSNPT